MSPCSVGKSGQRQPTQRLQFFTGRVTCHGMSHGRPLVRDPRPGRQHCSHGTAQGAQDKSHEVGVATQLLTVPVPAMFVSARAPCRAMYAWSLTSSQMGVHSVKLQGQLLLPWSGTWMHICGADWCHQTSVLRECRHVPTEKTYNT